ncbi:CaiB/BaiF CoA-transferase family protein [Micromonospora sp. MA102]|uniref:CaiB/BaiF CoA transferase family protein n=1 Tax=Micromonospora sp. MA102 TaxID=2952755 RepID=UPI0021C8D651|nr:CoA transferase [Micromonospora sp. MA102]
MTAGEACLAPPALAGIVVADFSRVLAGPMATSLLADLGATVVKVERPGTGDETRSWGPPWTDTSSAYFESVNRSKRGIELDFTDPARKQTALDLIRQADVLVENFRTGTLDRLGLGFADAHRINPRLVYCSLTGFGSAAGAALPGYDFVVQALGGLMSITGDPDGPGTKVGVALVDVLCGKDAVIGILAALAARDRDGVGQHVEVNLLSSLLGSLVNQAGSHLTTGRSPVRMGNRHPSIAPYETLRCADGLIAVACGNDGQFRRMARLLGREDLADDPRFATNPARVAHRDELASELEDRLRTGDADGWQKALMGAGVAAGRVNDVGGAFELARTLGLEPSVPVGDGHPDQVRHPIRFSRTGVVAPSAPPALGQHTEEIRQWLDRQTRDT